MDVSRDSKRNKNTIGYIKEFIYSIPFIVPLLWHEMVIPAPYVANFLRLVEPEILSFTKNLNSI